MLINLFSSKRNIHFINKLKDKSYILGKSTIINQGWVFTDKKHGENGKS